MVRYCTVLKFHGTVLITTREEARRPFFASLRPAARSPGPGQFLGRRLQSRGRFPFQFSNSIVSPRPAARLRRCRHHHSCPVSSLSHLNTLCFSSISPIEADVFGGALGGSTSQGQAQRLWIDGTLHGIIVEVEQGLRHLSQNFVL
ncbi:hypothetical protein COP1_006712 [Malus domestica]